MSSEKQAFLTAVTENPYDEVTRRVYADWLSEHGFDDEATVQYEWTKEKYDNALTWMEAFAKEVVQESDEDTVTVQQVLQAARDFLHNGHSSTLSGLGFNAENAIAEPEVRELFWANYGMLEDVRVTDDVVNNDDQPFVCGC